jgi:hypothetical protein
MAALGWGRAVAGGLPGRRRMDTVNLGAPGGGRGIWTREFRPGHVIGALGICVGVATQLNNQMSDKFLCCSVLLVDCILMFYGQQ